MTKKKLERTFPQFLLHTSSTVRNQQKLTMAWMFLSFGEGNRGENSENQREIRNIDEFQCLILLTLRSN